MLEARPTALADLTSFVPGRVHLPGSDDYSRGVAIWNGAVTARPAAVARPRSSDEVQQIVRFAREHDLALTVRGGGHDWAGRALNDGGLVVDLSGMRQVRVDPVAREAVVDGGATADDVVRAAESHGLTAATGTVGDVGMVGFTLAGGYGPLNGIAGLGVDNLIEAQVVLADGRSVTATEATEPDLFWALRGGGGNFGVVTRIRLRLHPVGAVTTGVLVFPWQQANHVLRGYDALIPSMPDHLTVQSGVISTPDGQPAVFLAPTWVGDSEEASSWIGEVSRLGSPVVEQVASMSPSLQLHLLDEMVPRGRSYELRTVNLAALSTGAIDALVRAGSTRTSPFSMVAIHHFHGASTRIGLADTAFGIRTPHFMVEIIAAWESGDATVHQDWAQALFDALRVDALPGGYPNLMGPNQRSQADAAYGPNAERLLDVKKQWDGANTFAATLLPSRR
ncbi:FAD-dependent oxidoreductase [Mycolicibacterium mengxianglii]|uniref:FAD-dependent oxidoreductase n=1 Tax=Mycolicibacterium mengxianglii TaxID=2736649 RepID=UPI0018EEE2CB|nr:FAD-binding oxidoreductase [Mycolicibacterium mengxianglii]